MSISDNYFVINISDGGANINYICLPDISKFVNSVDLEDIGIAIKGTRIGYSSDRGCRVP